MESSSKRNLREFFRLQLPVGLGVEKLFKWHCGGIIEEHGNSLNEKISRRAHKGTVSLQAQAFRNSAFMNTMGQEDGSTRKLMRAVFSRLK